TAICNEALFRANAHVRHGHLVARKHNALDVEPEPLSSRFCSSDVCSKGCKTGSGNPWVVMRECVGCYLLSGSGLDQPNERWSIVKWILRFIFSNFVQHSIGIQVVVRVLGQLLGYRREQLLLSFEEEETHGGPSRTDSIFGEQGEHSWNRTADPEQVFPVLLHTESVAYSPMEFEI